MIQNLKLIVRAERRFFVRKRKNVHAGIRGYLKPLSKMWETWTDGHVDFQKVTYNPYKYESFVDSDTEKPVYFSSFVRMEPLQVLAVVSKKSLNQNYYEVMLVIEILIFGLFLSGG